MKIIVKQENAEKIQQAIDKAEGKAPFLFIEKRSDCSGRP